jgi:hypothetical protein
MANRPRNQGNSKNHNNGPTTSAEKQPPLSEYDKKILAVPTPLELASKPGSETTHINAQAAYDEMQTDLDSTVASLKQDYDNGNRSGNAHVSPAGPGLDSLNLLALIAHQKDNQKNAYNQAPTPSATMAQEIITAYPNPKDILVLANHHLEQVVALNQRRGITVDIGKERNVLYRVMKTIYGKRFEEFENQAAAEASEQAAAQAMQQQEAQAQLALERQATAERQLDEEMKYNGREIIANSKANSLERRRRMDVAHQQMQMQLALKRNLLSSPKQAILAWRKDSAEAKLRRKQAKLGTSMFGFINRRRARSVAKASKQFNERSAIYSAHKRMMDGRVAQVDADAAARREAYKEKIRQYSEQKIRALEDKKRRVAVEQRELHYRNQGMRSREAKLAANNLSELDRKKIRAAAIKAAKREAIRNGYDPGADHDRD